MMWDDLAARARGLAAHLMPPAELAALGRARTTRELAARLAAAGWRPEGTSAQDLERAGRRLAAQELRVLARWAGPRDGALAVLFADEDRRSLRGILRGVAARAPAAERVAAALPTPALPAAALLELARQPSVAAVAALLRAWGHPFGEALAAEAARSRPDPLALELALDRLWARDARRGARRGGPAIRAHVGRVVDAENVFAAVVLAAGAAELDPAETFLPGGARLGRDLFLAAIAAGAAGAPEVLARALRGTRLGAALAAGGDLEGAALADQLDAQRRLARLRPTGAAPVIAFVLGRRAELRAVRGAAWRLALGGSA
jgi:vacuolar-type H+-ATPase subunit C/Vma6